MDKKKLLDNAHFIMEDCKRDLGIGINVSAGDVGDNYGVAHVGKLSKLAIKISEKHIKSFRELVATVAHEVRHIWQAVKGFVFSSPDVSYENKNEEIGAENYAKNYSGKSNPVHGNVKHGSGQKLLLEKIQDTEWRLSVGVF